jgi:hypothetical protein
VRFVLVPALRENLACRCPPTARARPNLEAGPSARRGPATAVEGIAHGRNNTLPPVVKHIKRGCVEAKRDEVGNAYRWRVHSRAFKGEQDAEGVEATWTVCEPVVRAIKVLEQLQPANQNYLMGALLHGPGHPMKPGVDRAVGVGATRARSRWTDTVSKGP